MTKKIHHDDRNGHVDAMQKVMGLQSRQKQRPKNAFTQRTYF